MPDARTSLDAWSSTVYAILMTESTDDKVAWVRWQIQKSAPPSTLEPGLGKVIAAIAEAVSFLETGSGQIFGLAGFTAPPEARQALAAEARAALEAWRAKLAETHGDEGVETVVTIAARFSVVLDGTRSASLAPDRKAAYPRGDAALATLAAKLADHQAIADALREAGSLEEDEGAHVEIGELDPALFERFAATFEAQHDTVLPWIYVRLLSTYNGIAVVTGMLDEEDDEDGADASPRRVPPRDLPEPSIWPVDVYGDHLAHTDVDLDGITLPFVFGEIADSGWLVFDAAAGEEGHDDAPVFWLPRHFATEPPIRIADSLAAFLETWCACQLDVGAVLRRAGVPGWGG